jgi:threonine dehydrogenase-like Zn-dependent dehydrogenase
MAQHASDDLIGQGHAQLARGLCAVLAARRLGRRKDRTDLGREFCATEVIAERGEEAVERVRELTGGDGTRTVLKCVGTLQALQTAFGVIRDSGTVSRVGVPQYANGSIGFDMIMRNITLTGGAYPARAYREDLRPTCSTAWSSPAGCPTAQSA